MERLSVEVFKTNIADKNDAVRILNLLSLLYPNLLINFDLDDCDNILRVEGEDILADQIIDKLTALGYFCEVLE